MSADLVTTWLWAGALPAGAAVVGAAVGGAAVVGAAVVGAAVVGAAVVGAGFAVVVVVALGSSVVVGASGSSVVGALIGIWRLALPVDALHRIRVPELSRTRSWAAVTVTLPEAPAVTFVFRVGSGRVPLAGPVTLVLEVAAAVPGVAPVTVRSRVAFAALAAVMATGPLTNPGATSAVTSKLCPGATESGASNVTVTGLADVPTETVPKSNTSHE